MIPQICSLQDAPMVQANLDAKKMYSSKELEIVHLHLNPLEKIPVHKNSVTVLFCVLEGVGTLTCGNDNSELYQYDVVEIPAGIERGLTNSSSGDLRVLVIKKLT